jgi:hypothetical protein
VFPGPCTTISTSASLNRVLPIAFATRLTCTSTSQLCTKLPGGGHAKQCCFSSACHAICIGGAFRSDWPIAHYGRHSLSGSGRHSRASHDTTLSTSVRGYCIVPVALVTILASSTFTAEQCGCGSCHRSLALLHGGTSTTRGCGVPCGELGREMSGESSGVPRRHGSRVLARRSTITGPYTPSFSIPLAITRAGYFLVPCVGGNTFRASRLLRSAAAECPLVTAPHRGGCRVASWIHIRGESGEGAGEPRWVVCSDNHPTISTRGSIMHILNCYNHKL